MKKTEEFKYKNCKGTIIAYKRESGKWDGEVSYMLFYPDHADAKGFSYKKEFDNSADCFNFYKESLKKILDK